jgi:hypothetical protein
MATTTYTATDGTVITVTQIITTQGQAGVFQAAYSGLKNQSGLADEGFGTSIETAIAALYQAAHSRRSGGLTPSSGTMPYR